MKTTGWLGAVVMALVSLSASATEVGLVTAVAGNVKLQEEKSVASELKPFVKVREGDRLMMESNARLQLVYFDGGRQETWQGHGALEVGSGSSKMSKGSMQPEVKTLPAILVKQLSKTPAQDDHVKTGMIRMRSMPPYDKLETVERNYEDMRKQSVADDLNPELYLLASVVGGTLLPKALRSRMISCSAVTMRVPGGKRSIVCRTASIGPPRSL